MKRRTTRRTRDATRVRARPVRTEMLEMGAHSGRSSMWVRRANADEVGTDDARATTLERQTRRLCPRTRRVKRETI